MSRPVRSATYRPAGSRDPLVLERRHELVRTHYDAFGDARMTWTVDRGTTTVSLDAPGVRTTSGALSYQRRETFDPFGRLLQVEQGKTTGGATTPNLGMYVTGSYTYDGRDRITGFTNAQGDTWSYRHDGAGRQRQVWRQSAGAAREPYMSFDFDGPFPSHPYDGTGANVVRWTTDPLGRPLTKEILDTTTLRFDRWAWHWDLEWLGALSAIVDPAGAEATRYQPHPTFGGLGWPTDRVRLWGVDAPRGRVVLPGLGALGPPLVVDPPSPLAGLPELPAGLLVVERHTEYDFEGRPTRVTWPSQTQVVTSYHLNGWVSGVTVMSPFVDGLLDIEVGQDAFGMDASWTSNGVDIRHTRSLPTRIDRIVAQGPPPRNAGVRVDYGYQANGWLQTKKVVPPMVESELAYTYDGLGHLWEISHEGDLLEEYRYDPAGNFEQVFRKAEGRWDYDPPARFHEVGRRTHRVVARSDQHIYDPVTGRMSTWTETTPFRDIVRWFDYDGAGRLTDITRGPNRTHITYAAADGAVREVRLGAGARDVLLRFEGWRASTGERRITEELLPFLRLELTPGAPRAELRWVVLEPDGHALGTMKGGRMASYDIAGAFGLPIASGSRGPRDDWPLDGLHGAEPHKDERVVHSGARHYLYRDGLWLQPEPLLGLGLAGGSPGRPLGFGPVYAAGNTNASHDRSGFAEMPDPALRPERSVLDLPDYMSATPAAGPAPIDGDRISSLYGDPELMDAFNPLSSLRHAGSEILGGRVLKAGGGVLLGTVRKASKGGDGSSLIRFGKGPESASELGEQAAKAEAAGFPHGVSTKKVDRVSGSDKQHRSAATSDVEEVFTVEQTGRNPKHHTVHLPKPVTDEVADQFNTVFKPVE